MKNKHTHENDYAKVIEGELHGILSSFHSRIHFRTKVATDPHLASFQMISASHFVVSKSAFIALE